MKKNTINTYTCIQGHVMVTRDLDEGTTPFTMRCHTCNAPGKSAFYNCDQTREPTHEFYKPAHPERYRNRDMMEHILAGGLAFRKIGDGDETERMGPPPEINGRRTSTSKSIFHRLTNKRA